jgi:regulatory protein
MPTVTALRATKRGRIALHVDDAYECVVSESLIARFHLFAGRELEDDELALLREAVMRERVSADAYRLLAHRARSRKELAQRLAAKGHASAAIEAVVERLTAEGLLNDIAFAKAFVADKRRLGGWGSVRIARELAKLGVPKDVVTVSLDEADGPDDATRARDLLERRGPAVAPLDAAKRRGYDYLVRRGFSHETAYRTVQDWAHRTQA